MGLFVQCLYALSLHLVSVVFGTAIPTSLYIFGKCFIYILVCVIFCCTLVHHIEGCCCSALPSGTKKQTCDHRQLVSWAGSIEQEEVEDHHLEKGLSPCKTFLAIYSLHVCDCLHQTRIIAYKHKENEISSYSTYCRCSSDNRCRFNSTLKTLLGPYT